MSPCRGGTGCLQLGYPAWSGVKRGCSMPDAGPTCRSPVLAAAPGRAAAPVLAAAPDMETYRAHGGQVYADMSPCREPGVHTRGVASVGVRGRVSGWRYALRTTNPPDGPIDVVTRWIVVTRAAVLPMTLVAGLVA